MSGSTTGIPRYRRFDGLALLHQGFRPFFLGAGLWALIAMVIWIAAIQGHVGIPSAFDPVSWHAHEMIFGFVTAVIAGFLLTAIPNWTGRMPLQGRPLAGLAAVWLVGRFSVLVSGWIGAGTAALLDLSFLALLLVVVLREILAGRNWRNLPMPIALGGLLAADALTHVDVLGIAATGALGQRLGLGIVVLLIGLVGGRIIPSFTRNWLKKRGEWKFPASFGLFDRLSLILLAAAMTAWIVAPESRLAGGLLIAAGLVTLLRLTRWRGHRTVAEPLVWSLHLGFAWLPVGLLLLGIASPDLPAAAGLHALGAGAMAGMPLAVMTRATLGHTGRPLSSDFWTTAIYLMAALAAAFRVAAPFLPEAHSLLLALAGSAWVLAFGLFLLRYASILLRPRDASP
ncbi:MAG: NnrS family protein [Alphaproteobacteria bacterium]